MLKRLFFLLLATAAAATASTTADALDLRWYGQSAFRIATDDGQVILVDPFIKNNPQTSEELRDLSALGDVDLILVTHGHGDHIGDTVEIAQMTGAKVALNADMGHTFDALGWLPMDQLIRFNKSGPITPIDGVKVTMVHAEHSSEIVHTDPDTGEKTVHPGGEPAGYIIEVEEGFRIYHAGDTGVFSDMSFIGEFYSPDLALLPIGGHFTMDPEHAAYAARELLKIDKVIPIHYGTFPPLTGTPEEFQAALGEDSGIETIVMQPGEEMSF